MFFQDADLEYDPIELNKFIKLINQFNPDLIIGSRLTTLIILGHIIFLINLVIKLLL